MSYILKLIPVSPEYVPGIDMQTEAKMLLTKVYPNAEIECITTDSVQFIDPGENLESISCNICRQIMDGEEWQHAMDSAYEQQFSNLVFTTRCCNKNTSLNDLVYKWPAGFSSFQISVESPPAELPEAEFAALQQALGTPLKIIRAHY